MVFRCDLDIAAVTDVGGGSAHLHLEDPKNLLECGNELKKLDVVPTAVVLTACEVQPNSYDLHTIASQWSTSENTKFRPTVVFVPTKRNQSPEGMVVEGMKRSNRHLAIVYPCWDQSERPKNLAVLLAARTAWAPLGESVAADENRLKGANGLHGDLDLRARGEAVPVRAVIPTQPGVGETDGSGAGRRAIDKRPLAVLFLPELPDFKFYIPLAI